MNFSSASQIGDEYQAFRSPDGDGLLHRVNGTNRLFYARQSAHAEQVLTTLASEGVDAMRIRSATDKSLYDVWHEMSRVGFFSNDEPMAPFGIAWLIKADDDVAGQLQTLKDACGGLKYHSPLIHIW